MRGTGQGTSSREGLLSMRSHDMRVKETLLAQTDWILAVQGRKCQTIVTASMRHDDTNVTSVLLKLRPFLFRQFENAYLTPATLRMQLG
jgi:hypothetical protein